MPDFKSTALPPRSFTVGDWFVVPSLNRLSRGEESVQIELKLMEVLVYLAERRGELVSKRDLEARIQKVL